CIFGNACRGGFATVNGADLAGLRIVVEEVSATANACAVGFGDAQCRRGGHGRIHGVASLAQDFDAGGGGLRVHRRHRASGSDGSRDFFGVAWIRVRRDSRESSQAQGDGCGAGNWPQTCSWHTLISWKGGDEVCANLRERALPASL